MAAAANLLGNVIRGQSLEATPSQRNRMVEAVDRLDVAYSISGAVTIAAAILALFPLGQREPFSAVALGLIRYAGDQAGVVFNNAQKVYRGALENWACRPTNGHAIQKTLTQGTSELTKRAFRRLATPQQLEARFYPHP